MFQISEAKKKKGVECCAYRCDNSPVKKLGGLCYKHYQRKIRETNPLYARYNQFKSSAVRRGKEFTITLGEFRDFCKRTGYLIVKGKRGKNATIDRRCNAHGYHIWNIQLLTMSANSSKGAGFNGENFDCPF
jgi:hypothetical protein